MQLGFSRRKVTDYGLSNSRRDPLRRCLAFDRLEDRLLLSGDASITVSMYADQYGISPGQTAGFTINIFNDSTNAAQGVTLSDPLPSGNWQIDTGSSIHPEDFVISGQYLSLAPSLSSLAAGETIRVHIVTQTTSFSYNTTLLNIATVNASNVAAADQNVQAAAEIALNGGTFAPFMLLRADNNYNNFALSAQATLVNYDNPILSPSVVNPNVTFYLFPPGAAANTVGAGAVFSEAAPLYSDTARTATGGYTEGSATPTETGIYTWEAIYGGLGPLDEPPSVALQTVYAGPPSVVLTSPYQGPPVTLGSGVPLSDSASVEVTNLSNGVVLPDAGSVTFYLFAPGVTWNYDDLSSNAIYTEVAPLTPVIGGVAHTGTGTSTGSALPTMSGFYTWVAVYSIPGYPAASATAAAREEVLPPLVAPLNYTSSGGDVNLTLSNGDLQIVANGNVVASAPLADAASVNITGADGVANNFTLDYSHGSFLVPGGITFDGGALPATPSNALTIIGGNFDTDTYDFTDAHDGSIQLGTNGQVVNYTNLTPLSNTGTADNVALNLPGGTVVATLDAGPIAGTIELVSGNSTFETTTIAAPSGSLTVNAGNGSDTVNAIATRSLGKGDEM